MLWSGALMAEDNGKVHVIHEDEKDPTGAHAYLAQVLGRSGLRGVMVAVWDGDMVEYRSFGDIMDSDVAHLGAVLLHSAGCNRHSD